MAGAASKTATNPSGTALRSHDFPHRSHYLSDHVHPPKAALELLLQSHRTGALLLACPSTTMASAAHSAFPTQVAYSHPGQLHHRPGFKKSSFRGTAPLPCQTIQPAIVHLGTTAAQFGHYLQKRPPRCLLSSAAAADALSRK